MSSRLSGRLLPVLSTAALVVFLAGLGSMGPALARTSGHAASTTGAITFGTPTVVDPIHTNGEPDIGIDPQGRVFVSGPTGTGTSAARGSVRWTEGGHSA